MDRRPSEDRDHPRATLLARQTSATGEDPFGPGDPLEVARLVRRTLAAAARKAPDVAALIVVADAPIPTVALARFARRALGPHGATVAAMARVVVAADHDARVGRVLAMQQPVVAGIVLVAVLGPGDRATVLALG
jgi:hypothetical protein